MSSGLPIFDGFVRRPALHGCHREMGLSQFEREGSVAAFEKIETKCTADSDVKLVR